MMEKSFNVHKIVVLVPFRNVGAYLIDCVNSLIIQQYENYEVYLLDDQSTDGALDLIPEEYEQIYKIRNTKRLGPMENIYSALTSLPLNDEDIVLLVDGDDYIFGEYAFQIVNGIYNNPILLTYGQYIDNYGYIGHCSPYTKEEFADLRKAPWKASHLKTFKYKLFKAFLEQDPNVENFKFDDGKFYMATSDQGIMIPLMEVAGFDRTKFIPNVIYCYRQHQNNDHSSDTGRQIQLEAENTLRRCRPRLKQVF